MGTKKKVWLWMCVALLICVAQARAQYSINIDLHRQAAYLIRGKRVVLASPISSGRSGHFTPTGSYKIIEKEMNHFSSLYGKIVDRWGRTVVSDADSDMGVPRGGRFIPAPMRYFMRFHGAIGMHAGYLPGYPASHGCVRMPEQNAIRFFNAIGIGTPVRVFGTTARTRTYFQYGPQPSSRYYDNRFRDPRSDPRHSPHPPWWRY